MGTMGSHPISFESARSALQRQSELRSEELPPLSRAACDASGNPYTLASQDELIASYDERQNKTPKATELKKLIPGNWGVLTLFRGGFDLHRKHAVVYAQL